MLNPVTNYRKQNTTLGSLKLNIPHNNRLTDFTLITKRNTLILFLLLIPSQLALHFWPAYTYVYGFRIDFLSPALYLTDILFLAVFILEIKLFRNVLKPALFVVVLLIVNIINSSEYLISIYKSLKVLELLSVFYVIYKQNHLNSNQIVNILMVGLVPFGVLGMFQVFAGQTLGSVFYWLGERTFTTTTPGIALMTLLGQDFLRAYSTFSHPNSFAGYLGLTTLTGFMFLKRNIKKYHLLVFAVLICSLLFTFSLGVVTGILSVLFISLLVKHCKGVYKHLDKLPIILILISILSTILFTEAPWLAGFFDKEVVERIDLNILALKIFTDNFLWGSGLGTFIANIPFGNVGVFYTWKLQPVHNIFLLVASESGLLGVISIFVLTTYALKLFLTKRNMSAVYLLIFVMVTGMVDHYWLTLQQNLLLLAVSMGIVIKKQTQK